VHLSSVTRHLVVGPGCARGATQVEGLLLHSRTWIDKVQLLPESGVRTLVHEHAVQLWLHLLAVQMANTIFHCFVAQGWAAWTGVSVAPAAAGAEAIARFCTPLVSLRIPVSA
jgi:hypothetical protein